MSQDQDQYDQLPDAIVERLRAHDRAVSVLTPAVDRAVAVAARAQFSTRPSRPKLARRWRYPAAAAALAALVAVFLARPLEDPALDTFRTADDVDGSGRVDILDAYALAKRRAADPGAVSQQRIDELASRIVSLRPPEAVL